MTIRNSQSEIRNTPAFRCPGAIIFFSICFILLLTADLAIKHWSFNIWVQPPVDIPAAAMHEKPLPADELTIVPHLLALKLTLNPGAVFGMMAGMKSMFILATAAAIGVVGYFFATSPASHKLFHLALALILSGALGNLYDRLTYSVVRDMLWLFPGVKLPFGLTWPGSRSDELYPWLFNPADAWLLIGIGLILIRSLIHDSQSKAPAIK